MYLYENLLQNRLKLLFRIVFTIASGKIVLCEREISLRLDKALSPYHFSTKRRVVRACYEFNLQIKKEKT